MTGNTQGKTPDKNNCPGAATALAASSGAYMNNPTASELDEPPVSPHVANLLRVLNVDRLGTDLRTCQGDYNQALQLYAWNIEVASAFWGSFNLLEVALRNMIHTELSNLAGQET